MCTFVDEVVLALTYEVATAAATADVGAGKNEQFCERSATADMSVSGEYFEYKRLHALC